MRDPFRPMPGEPEKRPRRFLPIALAFLLSLLLPSVSAAGVRASIDKSVISIDETLQLELELDDTKGSPPDLSVLAPDFEILDRRTSHSFSVVNGRGSERHGLRLLLRPQRVGQLTIPPISFGDLTTESLPVSVRASGTGITEETLSKPVFSQPSESASIPEVLIEAELEPDRGYVGQQLILTAKVFMDAPLQGLRLHDPRSPGVQVLPLSVDQYQTERDGKSYWVYERRYALFPRDLGRLEIDPLLFEGWAWGTGGRGAAGIGYPSPARQVRASSRMLTADLVPAPGGVERDSWLPARSLSLTELGPTTYYARPGQPIERRIHLRAEGIRARDLPELAVKAPDKVAERLGQPNLWDDRRSDGLVGNRQEVVVLTAREPGHYRLPPVSLSWWSTTGNRWETAELPAKDLVVSAAGAGAAQPPLPQATAPRRPRQPPPEAEQVETTIPAQQPLPEARRDEATESNGLWIWIAAALGLAWLATMIGWWRSRHGRVQTKPEPVVAKPPPTIEEADPLQRAIDAVRAAYQAGDARAAREALLGWAAQVLPEQPPSNLARLAQRCSQPLREQILLLEEAFFSPIPVDWDKQPVWEGLVGFEPAPPEEPASFRRGKPIRRRAANPDAE